MIKVYFNKKIFWFNNRAAAAAFIADKPAATMHEINSYWCAQSRQWEAAS